MKIATWNVNSLKVRLPQVLDWLQTNAPDILCLQEIKMETSAFPYAEIESAGYRASVLGQKTYNGVAILSKKPGEDISMNIPGFEDIQQRLLAATFNGVRVVCTYFPNGQAVGSEKFHYKLQWIEALNTWLSAELKRHPKLVLAGDFNIAPTQDDVTPNWSDPLLVSPDEREAFRKLCNLGLVDSFRLFEQAQNTYSWWDYRLMAFRRNMGLRIDHILVSQALAPNCQSCEIDRAPRKLERPSDHAPVVLTFTHPIL